MAALTKEARDALPASDFALPGTRDLPMHDRIHAGLAWGAVGKIRGPSDTERAAARQRILDRAKTLGVDTAGWEAAAVHARALVLHLTDPKDAADAIDEPHAKKRHEEELLAFLLLAMTRFRVDIYDLFGIKVVPVAPAELKEFAAENATRILDQINETTKTRLIATLAEGEAAGEDATALAARVTKAFGQAGGAAPETIAQAPDGGPVTSETIARITLTPDEETPAARALLIAQTETTKGIGFTSLLVGTETGLDLAWHTQRDAKVREMHALMEGQTRAPGEPFEAPTGEQTLFPGGFGVPSLDIGCRCYAIPVGTELKRINPTLIMGAADDAWSKFEAIRTKAEAEMIPIIEQIFQDQRTAVMHKLTGSLQAMRIEAMSLDVPSVPDHPNKMPFSGILVRLDQPSDKAPQGAGGKRVQLSRKAAEAALPSLLTMAIDYTPKLDGHDPTAKIGVITGATIEEDALGAFIRIEGSFYAADFPTETARIQADKDKMGFSFEAAKIFVETLDADPLVITDCIFTGAAVLQKAKAAYTTTSLAAAADGDDEMTEEQMKALLGPITASIESLTKDLAEIKKNPTTISASAEVISKVAPHADALDACAAGMQAAGIGMHASRGHVAALRHMASTMRAEAATGTTPSAYSGSSYYAAADEPKADPRVDSMQESLKKVTDAVADLGTKLTDSLAAAAAAKNNDAPERKTLSPAITSLLAKASITLPEGDGKLEVAKLDAALNAAGLDVHQRMTLKTTLHRANLLEAA